MTKDEALRLALEALECLKRDFDADQFEWEISDVAITAIKAALESKDEPVAYINVEQRKLEWAKYMSWDTPTVVNLPKIPLYTTPPAGDIRALKHRIHELEGELLGYKKIVADQDAMLERQTARIVDLQTHIENLDGEDR